MKRIMKSYNSEVVRLKYPKHWKRIRELLEEEQSYFCAYTEYRIKAGFAVDIEHFNPLFKNTNEDNYQNWFTDSHKWNNKKSNKWEKFQPILHPTDEDFEKRIIYEQETASYIFKDNDIEAKNLIDLLDLNNKELVKERLNKILLLKILFQEGNNNNSFIEWISHPKSKKDLIEFRRAIETVFKITINN